MLCTTFLEKLSDREEIRFSKYFKSNGPMIALKNSYIKDHRIAVTYTEKSFYYCHVIIRCIILVDTYVYVATNIGDAN